MKIFFFFLSSAMLNGCASYKYPSKNITIQQRTGLEKEYGLLSVRGDSAVVVLDWAESKVRPLPYSHAEVIRKDNIANIIREGKTFSKTLIGLVAGLVVGSVLAIPYHGDFGAVAPFIFTVPSGILLGIIADQVLPDPTMDISLSSAKDREFLRSISAYPDKEPDEMQYIK